LVEKLDKEVQRDGGGDYVLMPPNAEGEPTKPV
jgi:hypothetical protein